MAGQGCGSYLYCFIDGNTHLPLRPRRCCPLSIMEPLNETVLTSSLPELYDISTFPSPSPPPGFTKVAAKRKFKKKASVSLFAPLHS